MATVFGGQGQVVTVNVGAHQEALLQALFNTFDNAGQGPTGNTDVISAAGSYQFSYTGSTPPVQAITAGGFVSLLDTSTAAGQLIASDATTMLNFVAPTGSGSVIAGGGTDTLNFGSGNWFVETSDQGTGSIVTLGSGDDTLSSFGADTIVAGSGNDTIFDGGAGGSVIDAGSGNMLYVGPTTPGAGATTVNGGSGTLTAFGGTGLNVYNLGTGFSQIVGGSGVTSITGGSTASDFYGAAGGTVDYTGSTNNNLLIAGAGNETLNAAGASGSNVFYAGTGDSTLVGGAGGNLFAFNDQGTSTSVDVVQDFTSADSVYLLGGLTYTESTDSAGDAQLMLSDGTTVTFTGVSSIDPTHIHG